MYQIGEIQIALLSDGVMNVDAGGPFGLTPRALYRKILEPDANNLIPLVLTCLLVRVAGKTILIDTGMGRKLIPKMERNAGLDRQQGDLLDNLARRGIQPGDVDLVIDTHLHGDHCAGNTRLQEDQQSIAPTFPNAEYVTQRGEYHDAMHPNERTRSTYFAVNYQPLVESGRMRLLDGDTEIVPGIHGVVTPGHTPYHMSIRFESQGQHALFLADLASYAAHFEHLAWMTAYDVEPLRTLETKRYWQQWALDTNALLIFQHDPKVQAGHLVEDGAALRVEPV